MKAIVTNKIDPRIKVEYKAFNVSVQKYHDEQVGYDGSPMWVIETAVGTASYKCSDWNINIEE